MTKPLPIRVESPCHERWGDMRPRGAGRHCERCEKTVVDLTRVTRAQAEALVRAHGGSLCGRLAEDERGRPVFRAEPKRLPVLAPFALASVLAACTPEASEDVAEPPDTQQVLDPEDEPETGMGLDASSASFGGSLATGVMMPMAPADSALEARALPPPEPVVYDGTPTAEQIALTRRKQRRQRQQAIQPPPIHHTMGVIACPIDP